MDIAEVIKDTQGLVYIGRFRSAGPKTRRNEEGAEVPISGVYEATFTAEQFGHETQFRVSYFDQMEGEVTRMFRQMRDERPAEGTLCLVRVSIDMVEGRGANKGRSFLNKRAIFVAPLEQAAPLRAVSGAEA